MLKELSVRNAKRQFKDYSLYFITLSCTVSFMYAFNSLIFSDIIETFRNFKPFYKQTDFLRKFFNWYFRVCFRNSCWDTVCADI